MDESERNPKGMSGSGNSGNRTGNGNEFLLKNVCRMGIAGVSIGKQLSTRK